MRQARSFGLPDSRIPFHTTSLPDNLLAAAALTTVLQLEKVLLLDFD